ncbi:hypothetical protein BDV23DRAFT_154086 [Aspergillus alliaceus]|uniref:Secreted protein n=1 Tax=Petromyces alliaceus TaxID=209559 RepID=A0A5N7C9U8_PETAA|nr:hypothetical protein BDV23DRAFT_154086 [Aspergillus alliaceus]
MHAIWIQLFPFLLAPHLTAARYYGFPTRSNTLAPQDYPQTICAGLQGNCWVEIWLVGTTGLAGSDGRCGHVHMYPHT